jgi:hypothetical protein
MTQPSECQHEDISLECPFCQRAVDPDMRVCETCKEMVEPVKVCLYCGEVVPEPNVTI